jgi:hypothetical protein
LSAGGFMATGSKAVLGALVAVAFLASSAEAWVSAPIRLGGIQRPNARTSTPLAAGARIGRSPLVLPVQGRRHAALASAPRMLSGNTKAARVSEPKVFEEESAGGMFNK